VPPRRRSQMPRVYSGVVVLMSVAVLGLGISCQRQQTAPVDARRGDEAVIRVTSLACKGAVADKSLDKLVSFYSDDALLVPPNAPIAHGREQIRQFWSQLMTNRGYGLGQHTTQIDMAKSGDLGYEMGTYELTLGDGSDKRVTTHGNFVAVWKEQGTGNWKMVAALFNAQGYPSAGPGQVQSARPKGSRGN
jgi:ketosteroid isomerase-like protein